MATTRTLTILLFDDVELLDRSGTPVGGRLLMEDLLAFLKTGGTAHLPTRVAVPGPKFSVPGFPPVGKRGAGSSGVIVRAYSLQSCSASKAERWAEGGAAAIG